MNKKIKNLMGLVVFFFLAVFSVNSASAYEATYDGTNSFQNDEYLTSAVVAESVTSIGKCVFECCSNLKKVTIPRKFASKIAEIFAGCNLNKIEINYID